MKEGPLTTSAAWAKRSYGYEPSDWEGSPELTLPRYPSPDRGRSPLRVSTTSATLEEPEPPPSEEGEDGEVEEVKEAKPRPLLWIFLVVSLGWILTAATVGLSFDLSFKSRALPGSVILGHDLSGMTADQIRPILAQMQDLFSLDVTVAGITESGVGSQMGIYVDADKVLAKIIPDQRGLMWVYRTPVKEPIVVDIAVKDDQFNAWLHTHFPDLFSIPVLAGVVLDATSGLFVTTPSAPGTGLGGEDRGMIQEGLTLSTHASVTVVPTAISVADSDLQAGRAQDWLNERVIKDFSFSWTGSTVYTLTRADIASLVTIEQDPDEGVVARFHPEDATAFIESHLSPLVSISAINEEVIVNSSGEVVSVIRQGVTGITLSDMSGLGVALAYQLTSGIPMPIGMVFEEQAFGTTIIDPASGGPPAGFEDRHWADVNLTYQTVTLMDGYVPTSTFLVSTGAEGYETPTGTFAIYSRTASQTISGCEFECYWYPDTHWVQWFHRDYGFHTAYWHEDFGQAISHGCVNMREPDAEALYNWMSIGSAVRVHY